jgi:hypothetical protein
MNSNVTDAVMEGREKVLFISTSIVNETQIKLFVVVFVGLNKSKILINKGKIYFRIYFTFEKPLFIFI